jgi:hypothetical protein
MKKLLLLGALLAPLPADALSLCRPHPCVDGESKACVGLVDWVADGWLVETRFRPSGTLKPDGTIQSDRTNAYMYALVFKPERVIKGSLPKRELVVRANCILTFNIDPRGRTNRVRVYGMRNDRFGLPPDPGIDGYAVHYRPLDVEGKWTKGK